MMAIENNVSVLKQVYIKDDGAYNVKILLDGVDVTDGCVGYTIERSVDGLPVLTLRYRAANVEVESVCMAKYDNAQSK
jgi:hypothetical protein